MSPLSPATRPRPGLETLLGAALAAVLAAGAARVSVRAAPAPAETVVPAPDAAERAVDRLWPALDARRFSRSDWERRAAVLASALDPEHRHDLARLVGDPRGSALRRVAAAELLRRVALDGAGTGASGSGLSPALHRLEDEDLAFLRGAAHNGLAGAGLACAARRALVDLGDWSDRLRLCRELAREPDREARLALVWCLRSVRDQGLLVDLAALLAPPAGAAWPASPDRAGARADTAELAAAALGAILDATPPPGPELRTALLERVLAALDTPFCPPEVRERLVAILASLGGPEARGRLERLTREGHPPAARALARLPDGRRALEGVLVDPRAGEPARLEAAAALALEPASSAAERAAGRATLTRLAAEATDPHRRARATRLTRN